MVILARNGAFSVTQETLGVSMYHGHGPSNFFNREGHREARTGIQQGPNIPFILKDVRKKGGIR
jgi:hypothetical protein